MRPAAGIEPDTLASQARRANSGIASAATAYALRGDLAVEYHEHADLSLLPELTALDPVGFAGFVARDKTVGRTAGAIPQQYRDHAEA